MTSKYTKLVCGNQEFLVGKEYLDIRKSAFLDALLHGGFSEDVTKEVRITPPSTEVITGSEALEVILRHCHGGPPAILRDSVLELKRVHGVDSGRVLIDLLLAGCYYQCGELVDECIELMERAEAVVPGKNLCEAWRIADEMSLRRLWLYCRKTYKSWLQCSALRLGCAPSPIRKLQIAFCIDTTGSMGACLGQLRVRSYTMLETIFSMFYKPEDSILSSPKEPGHALPGYYSFSASLGASTTGGKETVENIKIPEGGGSSDRKKRKTNSDDLIQFAALSFGDYCDGTPIKICPFCRDFANVSKFINMQIPAGGGPTPEAYEWAMHTAHKQFEWDPSRSCAKVLIVVGDSYPHPPSYTTQHLYWRDEVAKLAQDGIRVFGVCAAGSSAFSVAFMREISRISGGVFIDLGSRMESRNGWGTLCKILESAAGEVKRNFEQNKAKPQGSGETYENIPPQINNRGNDGSDGDRKEDAGFDMETEDEDYETIKEMGSYQIKNVGPLLLRRGGRAKGSETTGENNRNNRDVRFQNDNIDDDEDEDDSDMEVDEIGNDEVNDFGGTRTAPRVAPEIQSEEWWDVRNDFGNAIFEPTTPELVVWKRVG